MATPSMTSFPVFSSRMGIIDRARIEPGPGIRIARVEIGPGQPGRLPARVTMPVVVASLVVAGGVNARVVAVPWKLSRRAISGVFHWFLNRGDVGTWWQGMFF
jgi:hypothetical protein